jgi:hypothetical protein
MGTPELGCRYVFMLRGESNWSFYKLTHFGILTKTEIRSPKSPWPLKTRPRLSSH